MITISVPGGHLLGSRFEPTFEQLGTDWLHRAEIRGCEKDVLNPYVSHIYITKYMSRQTLTIENLHMNFSIMFLAQHSPCKGNELEQKEFSSSICKSIHLAGLGTGGK